MPIITSTRDIIINNSPAFSKILISANILSVRNIAVGASAPPIMPICSGSSAVNTPIRPIIVRILMSNPVRSINTAETIHSFPLFFFMEGQERKRTAEEAEGRIG